MARTEIFDVEAADFPLVRVGLACKFLRVDVGQFKSASSHVHSNVLFASTTYLEELVMDVGPFVGVRVFDIDISFPHAF